MKELLQIKGLKKHFGDNRVLDGIDVEIDPGSITTIIGKSGTGKSVFLKCIANLIVTDAGTISYGGLNLRDQRQTPNDDGAAFFSYMFQNNALFDSLTTFENVALPLRETTRLARSEIRKRVEEMLELLELTDASKRFPGELSGGMNKRVAFGRTLITKPQLVLFDEPTTGLDPERKFGVFDMIAQYKERFSFTALLVSHDIPEVFSISDKVIWLDEGRLKFKGTPEMLQSNDDSALRTFLSRADVFENKQIDRQSRPILID